MPGKSQQASKLKQRVQTDNVRSQTRTDAITTNTPKKAASTGKPERPTSGGTSNSSDSAMTGILSNQGKPHLEPMKVIKEVDETNIDEILNLPDLRGVPVAFLTEIEQDEVYKTIYRELQKKIPRRTVRKASPPLLVLPDQAQQKSFSPRLLPSEHDDGELDDRSSAIDDVSSSLSDEDHQDGYDTDIEAEIIIPEDHDISGRAQYRELCLQSKLIPCSYFMAHIQEKEMILRYHQFSTDDIRVIAKILCSNLSIERLLLDGNYLQQQAAKYISEMIAVNDFITELSLADNRLGSGGGQGTKEICRMLTLNRNLKKINLSGNKFNDLDTAHLVEAFEQNKSLRELDLSHNCFGEECGKVLGTYISGNDTLEAIDLSWNNIRGRSAIDIANGIKENVRLKRCNLEMNGFGPDGGQILADCIKQNSALEEFNINSNRLNTPNAFAIAQALLANDSMQVLKIANNQINCDGALAIFLCIKANESNVLREVDFSYTVVTREALEVCEDIVRLKDGKFRYQTGKVTPEILQPNSTSECYTRTNEELLNKFRSVAANAKAHTA